jgi:hypothetical protein
LFSQLGFQQVSPSTGSGSDHITRGGECAAGLRQCNGAAEKKYAFDG